MSVLPRYVWHPALHEQSGEHLFFIRLYFEPVYPDVRDAVRKRLDDLRVGSYHVYELIGAYDLMLRVWYAGNINQLVETLDELPEVRRVDYMEVRRIHEHWVHADEARPPGLSDLTPDLVRRINEEIHSSSGTNLRSYEKAGLIAPLKAQSGVKFFISVMASVGNSASINFNDVLLGHVTGIADDARRLVTGRSIYAGDGFARLLLMGRFDPKRYFEFMDDIVVRLNDRHMRQLFSARTFTAFGARESPLLGKEMLDPERVSKENGSTSHPRNRADQTGDDLESLLGEGEGQFLEVKASAFLNLDRLVHDATPNWDDLRPELVKAVCGLLNQLARERATLIIGAVETERYRQWLGEYADDLVEIGDFTVLGVEEDNPSGDWDLYQRRLADSLAAAIEPSPLPYMTLALEQHMRGEQKKRVMRLVLTPSGQPFYDRKGSKLWVRQGAQVRELAGRERDDYVRSMETGN